MPEFRRVLRSAVLEPPKPLRIAMDEEKLVELANSLRQFGMIHPIAVCASDDKWEIIDGHRRYIASGMVGWHEVDVAIFEDVSAAKFGMMLHANIVREDVTAVEEGTQFIQLATEYGWSIDELKRFFGRSESYINERAQLVSDFPDLVEKCQDRSLSWPQAKALMKCKDKARREYLLDQAVTHGANARMIVVMLDDFRRQDKLAEAAANPGAPQDFSWAGPAELPKCIWCGREDDPFAMVLVSVHNYHKRDLELLLDQVGNLPSRGANDNGGAQ